MSVKNKSIFSIFIGLVIILAINPRMIYNFYNTILGRLILIGIIIFFAMNNISLALIVSFTIILVLNNYTTFVEGFDNIQTPYTVGEENVPITGKQVVLTKAAAKISELKKAKEQGILNTSTTTDSNTTDSNTTTSSPGIDTTSLHESVKSVAANSIPVNPKDFRSEDVKPFSQSMLTNDSSLTEGFCPCAAALVF